MKIKIGDKEHPVAKDGSYYIHHYDNKYKPFRMKFFRYAHEFTQFFLENADEASARTYFKEEFSSDSDDVVSEEFRRTKEAWMNGNFDYRAPRRSSFYMGLPVSVDEWQKKDFKSDKITSFVKETYERVKTENHLGKSPPSDFLRLQRDHLPMLQAEAVWSFYGFTQKGTIPEGVVNNHYAYNQQDWLFRTEPVLEMSYTDFMKELLLGYYENFHYRELNPLFAKNWNVKDGCPCPLSALGDWEDFLSCLEFPTILDEKSTASNIAYWLNEERCDYSKKEPCYTEINGGKYWLYENEIFDKKSRSLDTPHPSDRDIDMLDIDMSEKKEMKQRIKEAKSLVKKK